MYYNQGNLIYSVYSTDVSQCDWVSGVFLCGLKLWPYVWPVLTRFGPFPSSLIPLLVETCL